MKSRVLVVDDERTLLFAIRDYFDAYDIAVDCAIDADQAARLCGARSYSVAIVDLRLGGSEDLAGIDITRTIRSTSPQTKIVVLTAFGTEVARQQLEALGVELYLKKPQPLAALANAVRELSASRPAHPVRRDG